MKTKNFLQKGFKAGSALILTVVITTLLAILGIMFLMSSRIDKMSTASIQDNVELNASVDAVIARISNNLIDDLSKDPNIGTYYDYPDANVYWDWNTWRANHFKTWNSFLANLEPCSPPPPDVNYSWRQITDIDGYMRYRLLGFADANFYPLINVPVRIIPDYNSTIKEGGLADADGDGVADSRWTPVITSRIGIYDALNLPSLFYSTLTTSKGTPVYTAVRVVDNSGMLNANTAYKFDANSMVRDEVDGSRVAQINLLRIAKGNEDPNRIHLFRCDNNLPDLKTFNDNCAQLEVPNRSNTNYMPYDISDELELRNRFLLDVNDSNSRLESAVQKTLRFYWGNPYRHRFVPIDTLADLDAWKIMLSAYDIDLNLYRTNAYDFRHLLTTYDLDTTYNPMNRRQQYVNDVNLADLYYNDFNSCVDPCASVAVVQGLKADLAQIAVNIKDYGDSDNIVSVLNVNIDGTGERTFYGFETPCIYISELSFAFRSADRNTPGDTDQVAFAIELFKRYGDDTFGDDFEIVVTAGPNNVERRFRIDGSSFATRGSKFYVKVFESDITKPLLRDKVMFSDTPENGATGVDPRVLLGWDKSWQDKDPTKPWQYDIYFGTDPNNVRDANTTNGLGVYIGRNPSRSFDPNPTGDLDTSETYYWRIDDVDSTGKVIGKGEIWHFTTADKIPTPDVDSTISYSDMVFDEGTRIDLNRDTAAGPVCVDTVTIPRGLILKSTDLSTGISLTRDIRENWCIKKLWSPEPTVMSAGNSSLGNSWDQFQSTDPETIEAHPRRFDNVGDVCKVFRVNAYNLGPTSTERSSMIDLTEPNMQRIFNYITGLNDQLFDKAKTKVKGRINVNTAPWYVIAQLPWVSPELARTIVAYRDKTDIEAAGVGIFYSNGRGNVTGIPGLREAPGFASIGELANVINRDETMPGNSPYSMHRYGIDGVDQLGFPDLTFNSRTRTDGAKDNQEELNLIFARISDLVTVRSDLFTAYILVRLGETGPQKRVIAILDRSDRKNVKVVARYPVPDPR